MTLRNCEPIPDTYRRACELKGYTDTVDAVLALDAEIRKARQDAQDLTTEKNAAGQDDRQDQGSRRTAGRYRRSGQNSKPTKSSTPP